MTGFSIGRHINPARFDLDALETARLHFDERVDCIRFTVLDDRSFPFLTDMYASGMELHRDHVFRSVAYDIMQHMPVITRPYLGPEDRSLLQQGALTVDDFGAVFIGADCDIATLGIDRDLYLSPAKWLKPVSLDALVHKIDRRSLDIWLTLPKTMNGRDALSFLRTERYAIAAGLAALTVTV